ncbi:hypothetical protein AbraIFM66951_002841 [Aspergillus brasiliensis]|uniref:FAD-binding domain-containing protein n=1 Tax=Aspergillus brasiliensis TaxID=319629 RepID=A0A9W5YXF8_9EURO|nr:hypothetical protein AbraCBS73388_001651 [Aspergillus brasiliensis]GKZ49996.1 hypothetical protein AbraIFM66951_002841 [Aspergillus brasiliensis]
MSIPDECTVLVVGGGPGGSYAASVLAREGISTVLLEADQFPRYHIGESLLPSTREFLKFIDVYDKFEAHGFKHKNGASFSYNSKPPAYTNFLAFGGHAWNVVRSECDQILFEHARESGAQVFDGVKVSAIDFKPIGCQEPHGNEINLGQPVSASWERKDKTASGTIRFKYLVDASGRAGLISTKYMKNRRYNQGLKNIATWGYFEGAQTYGSGTPAEGGPFFPRLQDGTGWAWFIPLHNNTTSIGVVMEQTSFTAKKKQMESPTTREFFLKHVHDAPGISDLLKTATLVSDVKSATDWSYSASRYASPYLRIVGDAGCFIDPLFSSGVHLALTGALAAAASICAAIKGDCSEQEAVNWHSVKIREAYTRFLLVVTSAYAQIRGQERPVLNELDEANFDRAFSFFRPIIQGTVEAGGEQLSREELADSVEFCMRVIQKVDGTMDKSQNNKGMCEENHGELTCDRIKKAELKSDLNKFGVDVVNGMTVNLQRGALGLVKLA